MIVSPDGTHRLLFIEVPEGKTVKNRLHLDLEPVEGSRDDELARLLAHGAVEVADHRGQYGPGTGWALAAAVWEIPVRDSLTAYLWSWCENQVMAALKAVPLGQAAGQRILLALGSRVPAVVEQALDLPEERWSNFCPGLALFAGRRRQNLT